MVFFSLNLLLGTFNLLPVAPLDGSTVILLFMGDRTAQRYLGWLRGSGMAMAGLIVGILLFNYIYGPINSRSCGVATANNSHAFPKCKPSRFSEIGKPGLVAGLLL